MQNTDKPDKPIPVLFLNKENCCGCFACFCSCPVNAISMREDEEGFMYPAIEADKCIRCFKCLSVCAFKADQTKKYI